MKTVRIWVHSKLPHNNIILTGFKLLEKKGKVKLKILRTSDSIFAESLPFNDVLEVKIEGKRIAFDMLDGYQFNTKRVEQYIEYVDFYFKRSYSKKINQLFSNDIQKKIYPLSLNWNVSYFTNPVDWQNESWIRILKTKLLYRNDVRYYETSCDTEEKLIIFMCRLWDPLAPEIANNEILKKERIRINDTRIDVIRYLKEHYKNSFVGGVADSPVSRVLCPDLILPKQLTNRRQYIKLRLCPKEVLHFLIHALYLLEINPCQTCSPPFRHHDHSRASLSLPVTFGR